MVMPKVLLRQVDVFWDTEQTDHDMLELALWIPCLRTGMQLVCDSGALSDQARTGTGLTDEDVKQRGRPFAELWDFTVQQLDVVFPLSGREGVVFIPRLISFASSHCDIGKVNRSILHSREIADREASTAGRPFRGPYIPHHVMFADCHALLTKRLGLASLDQLLEKHGLPPRHGSPHTALGDSVLLAEVWKRVSQERPDLQRDMSDMPFYTADSMWMPSNPAKRTIHEKDPQLRDKIGFVHKNTEAPRSV
jgi:hypothetical protein